MGDSANNVACTPYLSAASWSGKPVVLRMKTAICNAIHKDATAVHDVAVPALLRGHNTCLQQALTVLEVHTTYFLLHPSLLFMQRKLTRTGTGDTSQCIGH